MSSQPSQKDVARSTVASAVQTVADAIDPSQTKDGESKKEPTLKDKLDQAAYTSTYNTAEQKKEETFMEKGITNQFCYSCSLETNKLDFPFVLRRALDSNFII